MSFYHGFNKLILLCFSLVILSGEDTKAIRIIRPKTLRCQDVMSNPGYFTYTQPRKIISLEGAPPQTCLTMFRAPVDKKIEVRIQTHNVSCKVGGQIGFIDGLNLQDDFFPGLNDAEVPANERITVLCDEMGVRKFVAHQNVATILFQFAGPERGFTVHTRYIPNPEPCNVVALHPNATGWMKIQNFGHRRNCSYLVLYPTKFVVMKAELGRGFQSRCSRGSDFFEIRSGENIDPLKSTERVADSCQYAMSKRVAEPGFGGPFIAASPCYASVVRLVSSGRTNNEVLIKHKPMDLREADRSCRMTST